MSLHKAIPCPASTASIACGSSRKLKLTKLPSGGTRAYFWRAAISQRLHVGASASVGGQAKSISGYVARSAGLKFPAELPTSDGLPTTLKRSRNSSTDCISGGGDRAYRIAISASPVFRLRTSSVTLVID